MAADLLFLQRVRQTGNAVLRDRPVSATQRQRRPVSSSLVLQGKVQQRQRPAIADNAGLETVKRPRGHWISWPVKGSIWRRRLPGTTTARECSHEHRQRPSHVLPHRKNVVAGDAVFRDERDAGKAYGIWRERLEQALRASPPITAGGLKLEKFMSRGTPSSSL